MAKSSGISTRESESLDRYLHEIGKEKLITPDDEVRLAKEMSYSARIILGDEAVRVGLANRAEKNKEDLDSLVDKISSQISSNSQEAVTAFKDLYNLAQSGLGLDEALKAELDKEYPKIKDTNERLSEFK